MKVALVCDWLTNVGGAEKVLLEMHRLFPEAPIYTSQYDPKGIDWFSDADVRTGWMQKLPIRWRRVLGPFRQRYFSHLNLSEYDLVISVTGAEAKAVKVPNGTHVSYCHVPTQYYWQMYNEYMKNPGFGVMNLLVRPFFRLFVKPLRRADLKAARRVDEFVTSSDYAKDMIKKCYGREAVVIHPPVEFDKGAEKITFLPLMKKKELASWVAKAKGYLFPSMEPFGIAPVEALAAGCPVIAFGEGGARDYVQDGKNGLLFDEQTAKSLAEAILEFEKKKFNREKVSKTVKKFAMERFDRELLSFVKKCEKKNAKKSKK